ncbi:MULTISPECIES: hypothetical protein [Cupriavidus]
MASTVDQLTTMREYRSSATAGYNQSSPVWIYVMSEADAWLGLVDLNRRFSTLRATDTSCRLFDQSKTTSEQSEKS